jgi:hypothetical protein
VLVIYVEIEEWVRTYYRERIKDLARDLAPKVNRKRLRIAGEFELGFRAISHWERRDYRQKIGIATRISRNRKLGGVPAKLAGMRAYSNLGWRRPGEHGLIHGKRFLMRVRMARNRAATLIDGWISLVPRVLGGYLVCSGAKTLTDGPPILNQVPRKNTSAATR